MLYEAPLAQRMAVELDKRGVFVAGFFYPVVPEGKARIRTQMSSALDNADIEFAIDAFIDAGRAVGVI
jgi:glycine C-acetyltransferase